MIAHAANSRTCLGFIPIETGVLIISIFGILNKLSGFYGLISLDTSDPVAFVVYIYSLLSIIIFAQGLYGIHTENVRIVRWYVIFYWLDCIVSAITTAIFAIKWYVYTDHSLPELAGDPAKQKEHDDVFRMEGIVSVVMLVVLYLVHIYFAVVLTMYYRTLGRQQYSKLAPSVDEDLEDLGHNKRSARRSQF
ncbi:Inositolphosphorylceramide synthase subunit Kei1-domain-containing protein [Dichotomocladium elegans]|nr:Inositolphosphorylceramide synthase subunit Kei1-domain-containing protein [Dichotomocladium elegans]